VGYRIQGPTKTAIFIPDINKWEIWERDIEEVVLQNDILFLDGTFYKNGEIPGRDMSEFPHPFIEESISQFSKLPGVEQQKIYFIHLNHTNPAIHPSRKENREIQRMGFNIARQKQIHPI
jgi:pyrroloquinoline quinone biosynthesis protein B